MEPMESEELVQRAMLAVEAREPEAIALLKGQHREVEAIFAELEGLGPRAHRAKEKLVETLAAKLLLHMQLEEKIFYPAVEQLAEDDVLVAFVEHDAAKTLLRKLAATEAKDESFRAKERVLKQMLEGHIEDEERVLFPKASEQLDADELAALSEKMQAAIDRAAAKVKAARKRRN